MFLTSLLAATEIHNYHVPWFLYAIVAAVLVAYGLIEAHHTKHDHEVKFKEAIHWSILYISAALLFAIPVFIFINPQAGGEYLAAWAIEKALSLDNLFIMGLIFTTFKVPVKLERRMLNYGIAGAIILRLVFILAGYELLRHFEWVSIIFGLVLLRGAWKALQDARGDNDEDAPDITEKRLWKTITKVLPVYPKFVGHQLITVEKGKRLFTLMTAVIILIEFTDIIFAVDSVPAVLAVSPDRFIAYASNVFAILGLRALFFVYQAIATKFWALSWALSAILAWIAFKMITAPFGLHIPVSISLAVLGILLSSGIGVSLLWKKEPAVA